MKKIITLLFLLGITKGIGQIAIPLPNLYPVYVDAANGIAAYGEEKASRDLKRLRNDTNKNWLKTATGTVAEETARNSLRAPTRRVHFINYANMCDAYVNNKKRNMCEAKMQYLIDSHRVVYNMLRAGTLNDVRKGTQDQIWEKYASICTIITQELEAIKRSTEKRRRFKYLKYLK